MFFFFLDVIEYNVYVYVMTYDNSDSLQPDQDGIGQLVYFMVKILFPKSNSIRTTTSFKILITY